MKFLRVFFAVLVPLRLVAQCLDGRPQSPTLGIGLFQCISSAGCMIGAKAHVFSTEPSLWKIDPNGPSAGQLRDGDVLVAIDGNLITTRAGGQRIADLTPGNPVVLRVRRAGVEADVRLTPVIGCTHSSLVVMSPRETQRYGSGASAAAKMLEDIERPTPRHAVSAGNEFGMVLECGDCAWRTMDGATVFATARPAFVRSVDANGPAARAGVEAGDMILAVNGVPITDTRAGRALGALKPGYFAKLGVWRQGEMMTLSITPQAVKKDDE